MMLDVFKGDAFGLVELTTSLEKLPYVPSKIGSMGLFKFTPTSTLSATIEERSGRLALLPVKARGTMPTYDLTPLRNVRIFPIPHIPVNMSLMADEVQGKRAFGTEDELEAVNDAVNDKLAQMKQSMEVTVEYHRIGALHGRILDADGTTELYDLFDEFGITEASETFNLDSTTEEIKLHVLNVIRLIEDALGAASYTKIWAMCGNAFWDALITNTMVKESYDRWQFGQFFREQQDRVRGFEWGGVWWFNYRGSIGSVDFVDTDTCRFFPEGVPDLFQEIYGPADFMETVNTPGKKWYAKQRVMDFDKGVELHGQTNPLLMCTRPRVLVKGIKT